MTAPDPADSVWLSPDHPFHVAHMRLALDEAHAAAAAGEVPVGAVVVSLEHGLLARAHDRREEWRDPTAHAELIAIREAAPRLPSWRLENCVLYVTLEPCPMCAGAVVLARVPWVVYGCTNPKAGACDTLFRIPTDPRLNHRAAVVAGVLAADCAAALSDFFAAKRRAARG
jgi:tRNA(adenine34) deaminase